MDSQSNAGSTVSNYSQVSYMGEEVSADQAVDEAIKDLQKGLNNIQCRIREMLCSDERGDDYDVMKEQFDSVDVLVKEGAQLFKDVKSIAKQLVPPKPRATKAAAAK